MGIPAFFIIPGNPPAVHFYELWKNEILELLPNAIIRVAVYPNAIATVDPKTAMQFIADNLTSQVEILAKECASSVVLLGHSLGGYFAYEVLKNNPSIVANAVLLFPFLRKPTLQGQWILQCLRAIHYLSIIKNIVFGSRKLLERMLPVWIHIKDEELRVSFDLAFLEYHTIGQDNSELKIPLAIRSKLHLLYVPGDVWCSSLVINTLRAQVQSLQVDEPHAFIVSQQHRRTLLHKISRLMQL